MYVAVEEPGLAVGRIECQHLADLGPRQAANILRRAEWGNFSVPSFQIAKARSLAVGLFTSIIQSSPVERIAAATRL